MACKWCIEPDVDVDNVMWLSCETHTNTVNCHTQCSNIGISTNSTVGG